MNVIAIHGKQFESHLVDFFANFLKIAEEAFEELHVSHEFYEQLERHGIANKVQFAKIYDRLSVPTHIDLMICLGGDGTLLDSLTYIVDRRVPVLGINVGRLGFLNAIPKEEIKQALSELKAGHYRIDKRTILKVESGLDEISCPYALNDLAVLKKDTSSMITVKAWLDDEFLNSYWADGLIVSTPTGSTGYSLSCGGPIVVPSAKVFVMTPICPHSLTVRPLIIDDQSTIRLDIKSRREEVMLSLDSRSFSIASTSSIKIKRCEVKFSLVRIDPYSFLDTLRKKLHWGIDSRN